MRESSGTYQSLTRWDHIIDSVSKAIDHSYSDGLYQPFMAIWVDPIALLTL